MAFTKFKLVAPAAGLGLSLIVAGCGSSMNDHEMGSSASPAPSSTSTTAASATPASGPHNEADVMFASMMIPHHNQAIEMSEVALSKDGIDSKVVALAQKIKGAQGPEVAQMTGWLVGWGKDPSMSGMNHGGDDGIMSQAEMAALKNASGAEAPKLFLDGMIKHHTGAIAMAQTELNKGSNPDAKKLAQAIIDAQQAEITEMKGLGGK